jgi:hypothetical protein
VSISALPVGPQPEAFSELPAAVERALRADVDRVGVVLLDAFGWTFAQRHADHPFLRRLAAEGSVRPMASQFPSTTTAHVTTMHSGLPVGAHGLYEWNVYEPALDEIIVPIIFARGGELTPDTLRGSGVEMRDLLPPGTLYERLGVPCTVISPAAFSPSTYDSVATAGAKLEPYDSLEDGVALLERALSRPGYAYLYWHVIDAVGHEHGPDSPEFDAACVAALDALDELRGSGLLLVTADHGQVAVHPSRVDYLEDFLPEVGDYLARGLKPAGSARDLFLHAAPGLAAELAGKLRERLDGRADVHPVEELEGRGYFGEVGPRLRARLADVCVLPHEGREAWLRSAAGVEQRFLGHHGGLAPDEAVTWLGAIMLA